jgi:predicted nicotinamide N-methyase
LTLHLADTSSGLSRAAANTPYWAFAWAGGCALARYVMDHPDLAAGRRVLDVCAGSGLAGLAAARAGAASVVALDRDPVALQAVRRNATLNGLEVEARAFVAGIDGLPAADLILAGDVFYSRALARAVLPGLEAAGQAGVDVLIGDPGRASLPRHRLIEVARVWIEDFGAEDGVEAMIFRLKPG